MRAIKLSRSASHRTSLVKNLATSLLLYEKVQTTPAKARAVQSHAERLITTAKRWLTAETPGAKLALYRTLLAQTADELAAKKLIDVLAPRFASRVGGYTRRIRLARRLGDGAEQVVVTLTPTPAEAASEHAQPEQTPTAKKSKTTKTEEEK